MPELTELAKSKLLSIARETVQRYLETNALLKIDPTELPPSLLENGASFVTLTQNGSLRGCIGSLQAYQPLFRDVQERAIQAATEDLRFHPVKAAEFNNLVIEISVLTPSEPLEYSDPEDLQKKLRPNIDGVTIGYGASRATFLPQVWQELSEPKAFLDHLCQKMGYNANLWIEKHLNVETYQVIHFQENE